MSGFRIVRLHFGFEGVGVSFQSGLHRLTACGFTVFVVAAGVAVAIVAIITTGKTFAVQFQTFRFFAIARLRGWCLCRTAPTVMATATSVVKSRGEW